MKRAILSFFLPLMLCLSACGQPSGTAESTTDPDQLRRDIGEMLLVGFRGTQVDASHHIVRDIQQYHVGSVILFEYDSPSGKRHRNIASPQQLKSLCTYLQGLTPERLLISVDQEGGMVTRLKVRDGFPATLSPLASAKASDASVRDNARVVAKMLHDAGINLNFAPCVDVNVNPDCPVIGKMERSFSAEPTRVAECADIWIGEQRRQGILSCLKHFPGHGSAHGDTHAGLVDVTDSWQSIELLPYRDLIAQGTVDMVMVAHVINRHLDTLPASLSPKVIRGLLRDSLGFQGVIITDDLAMGAIAKQYGLEETLRLAILAGSDLFCLSNNGSAPYDPDRVPKAVEAIERMVADGRLSADDIHASAERVRKLKKKL